MPKVGMEPIRRQQLIKATMMSIDELGLAGTTIARIAQRAGVSAGIISHYFGGKDGLLEATMRHVLRELSEVTAQRRKAAGSRCIDQIRAIIEGNFDRTQIDTAVMKTWLEFWSSSLHRPELQRLQRVNERRLYSNLAFQFRRQLAHDQALNAARGLAAMIDGLWLRGALTPDRFDTEHAVALATAYSAYQLNSGTD